MCTFLKIINEGNIIEYTCVYAHIHEQNPCDYTCTYIPVWRLIYCFVFLDKYHYTFQITPAWDKSRVLMIKTNKNFSFSASCILWKHQPSSKDLWTRLRSYWWPQASTISATLVFPYWGDVNSGDSASGSAVAPAVCHLCPVDQHAWGRGRCLPQAAASGSNYVCLGFQQF